jgi:hypothetical protein
MQPFELPILLALVGIVAWFAFRRMKAMRTRGRVVDLSIADHPVDRDH